MFLPTHLQRARGRARRVAAVLLAPVLAAGASLALVTVAVATTAATATAASGSPVLVLLQGGETTAPETTVLQNAGYSVTQATPSQWRAMSASQFEAYAALVIGDPSAGGACSTLTPTTGTSGGDAIGATWQQAVNGNLAVLGTAPALPGSAAANTLISDSAGYAAARFSASSSGTPSSGTGLYASLNCEYSTASAGTVVAFLSGVEGIGPAGGLTVKGGLSCGDPGTVNHWAATSAGTFGGFTSASLAAGSSWSPGCPVQEAFGSWPAIFTPVAYDAAGDATANFTASDGVSGQPYALLGTPVTAATAALAPSAGGEVLAGATGGGTSNPAAPGLSQASAGDPVNTENGDFTQSSTDVSVPGLGPSLSFSRGYDAAAAQQQAKAGKPGPMGYGWTDNWASSLTGFQPVPGDIYAAGGLRTGNGNGGPAPQSAVDSPGEVTIDSAGDIYFADTQANRVQEIPASTGTQWGIQMTAGDVYTVAGSPAGYLPNGSGLANGTPAAQTRLNHPHGVAVNASGLYIADTNNSRVVEIAATSGTQWGISMTAGDAYTMAGILGTAGTGGDNGPSTSAFLNEPTSLHFGAGSHTGDLYIADAGNNRIQEVPATSAVEWGRSLTANDVYTITGSSAGTAGDATSGTSAQLALLNDPQGVTIAGSGAMFVADTGNCRIMELAASGGTQWGISMTVNDVYNVAGRNGPANCALGNDNKAATSSDLWSPTSVRDPNGNLYIADSGNNRIQEVAGAMHTEFGQPMAPNFVYTVAGNSLGAGGDSGDGGAAASALMSDPTALWLDSAGNIYLSDTGNNEVRKVSTSTAGISDAAGSGYTVLTAGDGGPAVLSSLNNPGAVASDQQGDIFIADTNNDRVQEIPASSHVQFGITMTAGDVYTVAGSSTGQSGYGGDGGPAVGALLFQPSGVAVDSAGNLYIADQGNALIRKVAAANGHISTIAGVPGESGYFGNGVPATSAVLDTPDAVAVDHAGDVFLADSANDLVQEIPAASGTRYGIAMTAGDIYAIAGTPQVSGDSGDGGPGSAARLAGPAGLAVDSAGDVYLSDSGNNQVREVPAASGAQYGQAMTAGDIYTIAGSAAGTPGGAGDGGPATAALLSAPQQLALDTAGDLYIADASNNRDQEVPAASGTQWSQSMTAGDIYTVAGNQAGTQGEQGDGGPAASAEMVMPFGIGTDPAGDLYVLEWGTLWGSSLLQAIPASATSSIPAAPGQVSALSPAPGGITVTQPGGSQVTFYAQVNGACAAPYQAAGQYCALPQFTGATLTSNPGGTFTYSPAPGADSYTYSAGGQLASETDLAGNKLTITYQSPAPGSGACPSTASSCETITAASGRSLVIGASAAGLVTSVTDPMGRTWTYAYNSASQLTSATSPMTHVTSYTYGSGATGNPALADDLLTITGPNAQPGGPDAGDATVNAYDALGRVASQTDPMGFTTTFNYCVNQAAGDCMNPATGTGEVTVTDPDGNQTVYDYQQGALAAQSGWTKTTSGLTLTSETDSVPDTTAASTTNPSGGTLLDTASTDGNGNTTTTSYNTAGNSTSTTSPGPSGTPATTTTAYTASLQLANCDSTAITATTATCQQDTPPAPVAPGGVITPPSSAPPLGVTYTLYDTDGNELYTTKGVYEPGATSAAYSQTTYQLYKGNTVTLPGTSIAVTCTAVPPAQSLPCATINADGVVTQLAYDSAGDPTSSSTPDGNGTEVAKTTNAYDADGEQTSTTAPDGNLPGAPAANYTVVTAYNSDGQKTTVTQAGGSGATVTPRTTTYGYDGNGNQTTVKDARTYTTTTAYNADDKATLVTNPDSKATLICYDGDGNVAQRIPAVGVAANSLTAASCPSAYPAGYSTRLAADATVDTFDAPGHKVQETTPAPAGQSGYETTTYTYDGSGNQLTVTAPPATTGGPSQVTSDTYNAAGELASETTGYGTSAASAVSYCYDPNGDKTSVVYADGNTSGTAQCSASSPWTVTVSPQAGYQTTYSYDSAGEQVSVTTPATAAAPGGAATTSTYDPAGSKLTSTDPNGVTTTWTYTPLGQAATESYSGSSAHSVTYSYDASGNQTGMTDASGTSSNVYDPFGEVTSRTNGASQAASYGYDGDGDVTGVTYPLPGTHSWATTTTVSYGYDNADQLTGVTDFNGHTITITPNADGFPATASLGATGDTITTTYDNTDAPSAIALKNASSTLQSFTYSNAPSGSILNETDTPSSSLSPAVYTYDAKGRVTSMTPGTGSTLNYALDQSSNLTTLPTGATTTYDKAGELTSSTLAGTATSYTYNADGEQLTSVQGTTTESAATWNGAEQLATFGNSAANMTAATYDGNGLRASTTITPAGGSAITQGYAWNAQQLLMDGTNAYIYATGPAPAEQVNLASGTITYLIADTLGSVRGTVSSAGALTATTAYDAWGNPETSGGLTAQTPFGFAGGYTDPSGLVYLINRYYSPQLGQFTSVDPELASTLQPYAYAGDNPVSDTDPDGLTKYKAVEYKPQCSNAGCINIIKMCTKNLKNCVLYWNTEASKTYKSARSAYLYVTIYVQGRIVTAYKYNKQKNANQKPFFHGPWGQGNPMGKYTYGCDGLFECTGYLKASDDVAFGDGNPNGGWLFKGRHQIVTIHGYWGVNKGRIVDWTGGGQLYAGLAH